MPEVIINGQRDGWNVAMYPSDAPDAPTAVILHPEPDKGGTMNNRVTYAPTFSGTWICCNAV